MQIDVVPLVWVQSTMHIASGLYRVCREWGGFRCYFNGDTFDFADTAELAKAAADAHHAAQVRSQVAGVTLSDDEAGKMAATLSQCQCETIEDMAAAVQAAIAAMQVDADPAPSDDV